MKCPWCKGLLTSTQVSNAWGYKITIRCTPCGYKRIFIYNDMLGIDEAVKAAMTEWDKWESNG